MAIEGGESQTTAKLSRPPWRRRSPQKSSPSSFFNTLDISTTTTNSSSVVSPLSPPFSLRFVSLVVPILLSVDPSAPSFPSAVARAVPCCVAGPCYVLFLVAAVRPLCTVLVSPISPLATPLCSARLLRGSNSLQSIRQRALSLATSLHPLPAVQMEPGLGSIH